MTVICKETRWETLFISRRSTSKRWFALSVVVGLPSVQNSSYIQQKIPIKISHDMGVSQISNSKPKRSFIPSKTTMRCHSRFHQFFNGSWWLREPPNILPSGFLPRNYIATTFRRRTALTFFHWSHWDIAENKQASTHVQTTKWRDPCHPGSDTVDNRRYGENSIPSLCIWWYLYIGLIDN